MPLLPWLADPNWAKYRFQQRLRLIQSMSFVDVPESVPGSILAVENDLSERGSESSYAAESLARYQDARAIPALRKALATEKDEQNRGRFIHALVACGGLTDAEQVEALEAYAAKLTSPEGRADVDRYRSSGDATLPRLVSIGLFLSRMDHVSNSLVNAVLARAETLQKINPQLAQSLLEVAHRWQGRQIDLDLIQRIATGSADTATIEKALQRRKELRSSVMNELQALAAADGVATGIAAVLLEDSALAQSVLDSGKILAQLGLLAAARLVQMPLPVETVGPLLGSKTPLLAAAAESYLLAEDSKAARELLWARHPGVAFTTGWRENIDTMGRNNFEGMGKAEDKLRAEFLDEDGPLEVFALIANHEQQFSRVLRVYRNKAVYTYYENAARYRERSITNAELASFKTFVTENKLDDLGPQFSYCHHDCWSSELLLLTREKGRRIFSQQGFSSWATVVENFDLLGRGKESRIHYHLENEIKGLEVLYDDQRLVVKDVWQRGSEVRIQVEQRETDEEREQFNKQNRPSAVADDETRAAERRQEIEHRRSLVTWRTLVNGQATGPAPPPDNHARFDQSKFGFDDDEEYGNGSTQIKPIGADSIVIARNFDGLWRQSVGQKAVRISGEQGAYANPLVTPDGKWVVAARTDSDWSKPNYVVRFNLQTGREYQVSVPPADDVEPVTCLPAHGKVLIRRARDSYQPAGHNAVGPAAPEYYLLDAATGRTQLTSGVFDPLLQEGNRFLQPTGNPDEYWAALPDQEKNQTRVGRYNLKDFSFKPTLSLSHIVFDSMSMWVDETQAKLFLVYRGHLLRLPLPVGPQSKRN